MTAASLSYRWTLAEFLRAEDAGVFDGRVELVDGEVWPVSMGPWHGRTTALCVAALADDAVIVSMESLASGESLPDPDLWITRAGAAVVEQLSRRIVRWHPADVLLVVEVSDETLTADLGIKSRLYAGAGYAVYWVVTREGVHEHTGPGADGYRTVTRHRPGESVLLPYADRDVRVDDLLADPAL